MFTAGSTSGELVHGQVKFTACGIDPSTLASWKRLSCLPRIAGIGPTAASIVVPSIRLPRMRGSTRLLALISHGQMFTPHARGSTCAVLVARSLAPVYRILGDRPYLFDMLDTCCWFTPHAWDRQYIFKDWTISIVTPHADRPAEDNGGGLHLVYPHADRPCPKVLTSSSV